MSATKSVFAAALTASVISAADHISSALKGLNKAASDDEGDRFYH